LDATSKPATSSTTTTTTFVSANSFNPQQTRKIISNGKNYNFHRKEFRRKNSRMHA
jgi:hypothetical protein